MKPVHIQKRDWVVPHLMIHNAHCKKIIGLLWEGKTDDEIKGIMLHRRKGDD